MASPLPAGIPQPPQPRQHFIIGFNLAIDRIATMRLMTAVGIACERNATGITLCISSPGGAPEQAYYAYEILRQIPVPLITHNTGITHSAAVILFLAGNERYCTPGATFLMH
jgi:ATP-dependent Clp protease protease subunit